MKHCERPACKMLFQGKWKKRAMSLVGTASASSRISKAGQPATNSWPRTRTVATRCTPAEASLTPCCNRNGAASTSSTDTNSPTHSTTTLRPCKAHAQPIKHYQMLASCINCRITCPWICWSPSHTNEASLTISSVSHAKTIIIQRVHCIPLVVDQLMSTQKPVHDDNTAAGSKFPQSA